MRRTTIAVILTLSLFVFSSAHACFGKTLKIGVYGGREDRIAAYALGWFIAEKTGIEPEFMEVPDPVSPLAKGELDLAIIRPSVKEVFGLLSREAGEIQGIGKARYFMRADVPEDVRFFTVDKALGLAPAFFGSPAYQAALSSDAEPKKAARKAVNDGT